MKKLLPLVCLLALTGCATTTVVVKIDKDTYWICDSDDPRGADEKKENKKFEVTCGSNPEKGLHKACFKVDRTIESIRTLPDLSLVVKCGERR